MKKKIEDGLLAAVVLVSVILSLFITIPVLAIRMAWETAGDVLRYIESDGRAR